MRSLPLPSLNVVWRDRQFIRLFSRSSNIDKGERGKELFSLIPKCLNSFVGDCSNNYLWEKNEGTVFARVKCNRVNFLFISSDQTQQSNYAETCRKSKPHKNTINEFLCLIKRESLTFRMENTYSLVFNPLSPSSDENENSLYIITTCSNI